MLDSNDVSCTNCKVNPSSNKLPLMGYRVLLVDGDKKYSNETSLILGEQGAQVSVVNHARSARAWLQLETPHLLILDLNLEDMPKESFFMELRTNDDLKDIPICILTEQPDMRKLIYERPVAPPDGYISKTIDSKGVLLNIRNILKTPHQMH